MTNAEKLQTLRKEYKTATKERRAQILNSLCRECQKQLPLPQDDPHWPFCSETCHVSWGDKTYGTPGEKKTSRPSIEELQRRIAIIVKEKQLKKNPQQKII